MRKTRKRRILIIITRVVRLIDRLIRIIRICPPRINLISTNNTCLRLSLYHVPINYSETSSSHAVKNYYYPPTNPEKKKTFINNDKSMVGRSHYQHACVGAVCTVLYFFTDLSIPKSCDWHDSCVSRPDTFRAHLFKASRRILFPKTFISSS